MATVTLNRKNFEKLGKIDFLEERLGMMGCPVDAVTDTEILVDVTPNRPDLLSESGIKRYLLSFLGKQKGLREYKVQKSDYELIVEKSVFEVRPCTACAIVKNLKFDDAKIKEIIDIQEKLHTTFGRNRKKIAIGIYPFDKIKFPVYFRALSPEKIKFQPLEESREMSGSEILTRTKAGREYAHLLEGKKLFPIFIDSADNILSMPPVINSHWTGKIDESTKDVFIECSGFDYNVLKKTLNIVVTALFDMGGQIYSMKLKYPDKSLVSPDLSPEKMKIDINYVNKMLGLKLSEKDIKSLLEKTGLSYSKEALIPAYRTDIIHPIDLVEDIAIAYGYDKFKEEIPQISTIGKEDDTEILKRKIAEILAGLSFLETYSYNLTSKEDECKKMNLKTSLIEVPNAKTNFNVLRSSMIPSMLRILSENKSADYPQKIFEIGKVFRKLKDIEESDVLAVALTNSNFTEAKQVLEYLARMLSLEIEVKKSSHESLIEGRVGKIIFNGREIGIIGEVSPQVLSNWSLEVPVSVIEINVSKI
jgi:phenylalanyl-tRNA synthetase beta chain